MTDGLQIAILIGVIAVAIVGMFLAFRYGYSYRRKVAEIKLGSAEEEAKRIIDNAKSKAVKDAEDINDIKLSTKINVQLITNNTHLTGNERMIMMKTREGIYEALDLAAVWLDDALDN